MKDKELTFEEQRELLFKIFTEDEVEEIFYLLHNSLQSLDRFMLYPPYFEKDLIDYDNKRRDFLYSLTERIGAYCMGEQGWYSGFRKRCKERKEKE